MLLAFACLSSIEYVEIDVAVTPEVLEKLIPLIVGMDGDSCLVGLLFSKFLLDGADVGVFEGLFKYLLHESGDYTSLQTKEFPNIISEMFKFSFVRWLLQRLTGVNGGMALTVHIFALWCSFCNSSASR